MGGTMMTIYALLCVALLAGVQGTLTEKFQLPTNGGEHMAIMSSGDVDDFGYNYIINQGRVEMENIRGISGTTWIPNILDNTTAIAVSKQLVAQGFKIIVSGTFSHGNAMSYMAARYPNVTFVAYSTGTTNKTLTPNLSNIGWKNQEFWYAIGFFAAATSFNEKVGFIHPGLTEGSIQSINAFYSGAKRANASVEVYTMFTGAYIAVDRANGACNKLVNEIGVGALTGQQDDLTVPKFAMASNLLAIGVTGYSLRQLYGELVGVSFVRSWAGALANVSYALANPGAPIKDILGSFASQGQLTDQPSYIVSADQWASLQGALAQLSGSQATTYLCGDYFNQWTQNAQGCVNTTAFNNVLYPGIHNLGYYNVPLTNQPFPHNTRVGIVAAAAILLAVPVILAILVVLLHKNPEIQAGSPFFFLVMLGGCILIYVGVIIWPLDPTTNICRARIWLPSLGATIAVAALITKNLRIFLLFFNPFKWRGENLAILRFLPIVLAFVIIDVIILAIYTAKGPSGVTVQQGVDGLSTYQTRTICSSNKDGTDVLYAILVFHMFQLVIGCIISFMLRNVTAPEFNERKAVGMALYVSAFCLIIVAILIGATQISNEQTVLFVSIALLICTTGVLFIIFGSRFVNLAMGEVDPTSFATKVTKSASATTKGSSKDKSSDGGETGVARSAVVSSSM